MAREIEYKFLVENEDWKARQSRAACRMVQGYLAFGDEQNPCVRLRVSTPVDGSPEEAFLTVKGWGEVSRVEHEVPIAPSDARLLLASCVGQLIQKTRHFVPEPHGHEFEIDVYEGGLAGLVVAEVELPSEDAPFDRNASFLGQDVSRDGAYKNAVLARDGMPRSRSKGPR